MLKHIATTCLLVWATAAQAAVTLDVNLVRMRSLPEADAIRARIEAAMPEVAKARLTMLDRLFGFDPRRDLTRVVIDMPDVGLPSARLVGVPAAAMTDMLKRFANGQAAPCGLSVYALPRRPEMGIACLDAQEALIGRREQVASLAAKPAALAPVADAALVAHFVPGPQPRLAAMALVAHAEVRATGTGTITATIQAHDAASAQELERRIAVMRQLVDQGAGQHLPELQEHAETLRSLTVVRHDATVELAVTVSPERRAQLIEQMLQRIERRLGKVG